MLYLNSFCDVAESTILQAVAVLFDHAALLDRVMSSPFGFGNNQASLL